MQRKQSTSIDTIGVGVGEVVDLLLDEFEAGEENSIGERGAEDSDGKTCYFYQ